MLRLLTLSLLSCMMLTATGPLDLAQAQDDTNSTFPKSHFAKQLTFTEDRQGDPAGPPEEKSINGYPMLSQTQPVCSACHYTPGSPIKTQWADSGHANMDSSGAWAHYNWSHAKRGDCQRCHTTTGFTGMADDPNAYFTGKSLLQDDDGKWAPEMLQCSGCHTDTQGSLRNPSKITDVIAAMAKKDDSGYNKYLLSSKEKRFDTVPDVAGVNLCLPCHTGGRSAQAISNWKNDNQGKVYEGGFAFKFNPHYMAAGGVLYQATPFEFDGASYNEHAVHSAIAVGQNDNAGPCVACHMQNKDHSLKAEIGKASVCTDCHSSINEDRLHTLQAGFEDAVAALKAELGNKGMTYSEKFPYFTPDSWGTVETFDKNLGTAFNYILISNESGAFVHNPIYTKQLLFDSIDWLQNGKLTGTITLSNHQAGAKWLGLVNGSKVARPSK